MIETFGGGDDPLADQRVLLNDLPLLVVERTGLLQDRLREGELADIVELRSGTDELRLAADEPDSPASAAEYLATPSMCAPSD